MYKRKFDVMIPKTSKTRCFTCHHQITRQEIRISFKKYDHFRYFHLNCFDPPALYYLKSSNLDISLSKDFLKTFESWLSNWNNQFFPLDKTIPYKIKSSKVIKTRKTSQSFLFSHIFEYLPINDIVNYCEFVCKSFYHAAWEATLWKSLFFRDFHSNPQSKHPRLEYIQENFERCLLCKSKPSNLKRNELLERNLCKTCKGLYLKCECKVGKCQKLFEKITKGKAEFKFGIYFDKRFSKLKTFDGCMKGNYFFYYQKIVEGVRRENRTEIIEKLVGIFGDHHEFIRIVENFDLGLMNCCNFYDLVKGFGGKYKNALEAVLKFIRNGDREDFTKEGMIQNVIKRINDENS